MSTILQEPASAQAGEAGLRIRPAFDSSGGDVLAFALEERAAGRSAAIVTLVAIDGSSPRALGAQMGVAADGRYVGSISSGCLERAIVEEARAAMARGSGGVVRYGKGSAFRDIVLPCGSGVDLLYTVNPSASVLREAEAAHRRRRAFALDFAPEAALPSTDDRTGWGRDAFTRAYTPALKIAAAGVGAELIALSHVASSAGYAFCAISPEAETLARCAGAQKVRLQSSSVAPQIDVDRWTAFLFLFHDREWELTLAPSVLDSPAFYIGAVGSRRTHEARLDALRGLGLGEAALARIHGPAGAVPATRDPSALAVSVLAGALAAWPHG